MIEPLSNRPSDEFRPVVAADVPGQAAHREQLHQHVDHPIRHDAAAHLQRQTLPRILVHDRQPLQRSAVMGTVMDEVPGPDVVFVLCSTPRTAIGAVAQVPLFPLFSRHFQPLGTPQPVDSLAVHSPAFLSQQRPHPPIAVPWMPSHQFQHPRHQTPPELIPPRSITLRRSWLSQGPARPTFADAQLSPGLADRLPPACRTYQFPESASLRIALSNSASASSFFSRLFSSSSCFSRLASSAFIPPYWFRQRWKVCSLVSKAWQTSPIVLPPASIASASRSFRMICSGLCRFRRRDIESPPRPSQGPLDSHNTWIRFRGAGHRHDYPSVLAAVQQIVGELVNLQPYERFCTRINAIPDRLEISRKLPRLVAAF